MLAVATNDSTLKSLKPVSVGQGAGKNEVVGALSWTCEGTRKEIRRKNDLGGIQAVFMEDRLQQSTLAF